MMTSIIVPPHPAPVQAAISVPKNIILIVGDGMGLEAVKAGGMFVNGAAGTLVFESFPHKQTMTTQSADNAVTDSAASASAMATGMKVNNNVVSVKLPGDGSDAQTVLEYYKAQGKATGLVTTSYMNDATPAAFGGHASNRSNKTKLWTDYTTVTRPNVLMGCAGVNPNTITWSSATTAGYTVVTTTATLYAVDTSTMTNLCGIFRTSNDLYYYETWRPANRPAAPTLNQMAAKALEVVDNDPDGFFLLIENENLDGVGHNSAIPVGKTRAECLVGEMKILNDTVQTALDFAQTHPDTLIVVTADHECGDLTVTESNPTAGVVPAMTFNSTGHTSKQVGVWAYGSGASAAEYVTDNTLIRSLLVPTTPSITINPFNATISANGTVSFSVSATGSLPLTYQWTKNGIDIPGATSTSLNLSNVSSANNGSTYRARVTNDFGNVLSSAAALSIDPATVDPEFTFVILPDTQFEVQNRGDIWMNICQWIADNKTSRNIQGVLSVGDVTNTASVLQFSTATAGYNVIDAAGIPFVPIVGNHDYDASRPQDRTTVNFDAAFGPSRFAGKSWYKGNYNGSNANYYVTLDIGTRKFLILALEFYPRPAVVTWANDILNANPDREVIALTHGYLYNDGNRILDATAQGPNSHSLPGVDASGEEMWQNIFRGKANMRAVISGHVATSTFTAHRTDLGDNGNPIHQILNNYQTATNSGDGWIGLLTFHPSQGTADIKYYRTYGPSGMIYDGSNPGFTMSWNVPPTVSAGPDVNIAPGGTATLNGSASDDGFPNPPASLTTTWSQVSGPGTATFGNAALPSTTATFDTPGDYVLKLTAQDSMYTSIDTMTVSMNGAPVISSQPEDTGAIQGGIASFSITANGVPSPTYQWEKNGISLVGETNSILNYTVGPSDNESLFHCLVTNSSGTVTSRDAKLVVSDGTPVFITEPVDTTAYDGRIATFTVTAFGSPAPTYQWKKGGVNMPGETNPTLYYVVTSTGDTGSRFRCVIANVLGSTVSTRGTLTVLAAPIWPQFTSQPADTTAPHNSTATFSVTTSGTLPRALQWYENGVLIPGATSNSFSKVVTYSMTGSTFTCRVTNPAGSIDSRNAILTVLPPVPTITAAPDDQSVYEGQIATFTVSATGTGPLTYQWKKGGVNIPGETNTTLYYTAALADDGAFIRCQVTNPGGSTVSARATLSVLPTPSSPTITVQPPNVTVNHNAIATFTVTVNGTTPFTYQWYENGSAIPGTNSRTLSFQAPYLLNGSTYTCQITNVQGSVTTRNAILTVNPVNPAVVTPPADTTVMEGQIATFTVVATGVPSPSYQWKKGGVNIAGETDSTLYFPATMADDGANIRCQVFNVGGSTLSARAVLTVTPTPAAPVISTQPADITVNHNGTASFSITATGAPAPTYQWYENGSTIVGASSATFSKTVTYSLNGSTYTCEVTNGLGSVTSRNAILTVNPVAPTISSAPVDQTVFIGQTATFTITANGIPAPTYQWKKGGVNIPGETNTTLYFVASSTGDDGAQIRCQVANAGGTVLSAKATLTVNPLPSAPVISTEPANITVNHGGTASFSVTVTGSPPFTYAWSRDGSPIPGASSATYAVPVVYGDNGATFSCHITNVYGSTDTRSALLTVNPAAPTITTPPADQSVTDGQIATFTVVAAGVPAPTYQWRQNGVDIPGETSDTLYFLAHSTDDGSGFRCFISNIGGTALTRRANLSVSSTSIAPTITSEPADANVNHNSTVTFSVAAAGSTPLTYQWSKNGAPIVGATSATFSEKVFYASNNSTYTCRVSNSAGYIDSRVALLTVNPLAPSITNQPDDLTVFDTFLATFTVNANGAPPPTYQWEKDGVAIPGATDRVYVTTATLADDGAAFRCVATNLAGIATSTTAILSVNPAPALPAITIEPADTTVAHTGRASFTVAATGTPPLTYSWTKDGTLIPNASSSTLSQQVFYNSNGALYQVTVTNSSGSVLSRQALLTVTPSTPTISNQPDDASVFEGQIATFTVVGTGGPLPTYQWQKDGVDIPGESSATLHVTATLADDGAGYRCVLTNIAGSVTSRRANLTVVTPPMAPQITSEPADLTVNHAGTAFFTVVATGTKPMSFSWTKNGTLIPGASSSTFSDQVFYNSNGALYQVTVTNSSGSAVSRQALLTVNPSTPVVTNEPNDVTVFEGQIATFTVAGTGGPLPTYQWRKNGVDIPGESSPTLHVTTTLADDGAGYSCRLTNIAGSVITRRAGLTVNPLPVFPSITVQPADLTVDHGETASFSVTATGTLPLTYSWKKNGVVIPSASSSTFSTTTFYNSNGATFQCDVTNTSGTVSSRLAVLTVNPIPPSITAQPADTTVIDQQIATFTVTATGIPAPTYQWRKDGVDIPGATDRVYATTVTLTDDGAGYRCLVTNPGGSVQTRRANLTVLASANMPAITSEPSDTTVLHGQTAAFTVVSTGTAPLSYSWTKNGTTIPGANASTFSAQVFYNSNGALYQCTITNSSGSAVSRQALLTVTPIMPAITVEPQDQNSLVDHVATFTVTATGGPAPTYQWSKNGSDLTGETGSTLLYTVLPGDDGSLFRCAVANASGTVNSRNALLTVVSTATAPSITADPTNQTVTALQIATFTVAATGDPSPQYQWRKDGVDIDGETSATLFYQARLVDDGSIFRCRVFNTAGSVLSATASLTVGQIQAPPTITSEPADLTVTSGDNASFSVTVTGTTPMTYSWSRNGTAIPGASSATYSTQVFYAANGSTFTCHISNVNGSTDTRIATLTVLPSSPTITNQPNDTTVFENQTATFTVVAVGNPSPTFQWRKNGVDIPGESSATLRVTAVLADDQAGFSCRITNIGGSVITRRANLTVDPIPAPPVISTQPANVTVNHGGTATFSVSATGTRPITFAWSKNGVAIPGASSSTLTFQALYNANGSTYTCHVTNAGGSVDTNGALLTVIPLAPAITNQPDDTVVLDAQIATFTVVATGAPIPTFQWRKDGVDIPGESSATLHVNATLADDGTGYTCFISNIAGNVTTRRANLTVAASSAPVVTAQPADVTVNHGGTAFFTVTAVGSKPFTYSWAKNGVPIVGASSATFSEQVFYGSNGALYECTISNIVGSTVTRQALLTVNPVAPTITSQPADENVFDGQIATFTVAANGIPAPTFQWRKNGVDIPGESSTTLHYAALLADDGAGISCRVTNAGGSVITRRANLGVSVGSAPVVSVQPADLVVDHGDMASFSVTVTGSRPLTYSWSRNGVDIPGASSPTFTTQVFYAVNGSTYQCHISNIYGSTDTRSALLTVNPSTPTITGQPADQTVAENAIATFTVTAVGGPSPTYQWRKNGVDMPGETNPTLLYTATAADDGAGFRCAVTNVAGTVLTRRANLNVTVPPTAPSITVQPADTTVNHGGVATFSLTATGSTPMSFQWSRNGTPIVGASSSTFSATVFYNVNGSSYTCQVSNASGTVTSRQAVLTVNPVAPSITVQPADENIFVGQTATFTVTATGVPAPSFQWRKDGVDIPGESSATLHVTGALVDDGAGYTCFVSNVGGSVLTRRANLSVTDGVLPSITIQPADITVNHGGTASFSVTATGSAPLSYSWAKDGVAIATATTSTFSTQVFYNSNGARFQVTVTNSSGTAVSREAVLTVNPVAPNITTPPSDATVFEGQIATFTIAATGIPSPTYQWRKDGVDIPGESSPTLHITAALADDGAGFRCIVTNPGGTVASRIAILTVSPPDTPPAITTEPADITVNHGGTASFSVVATGTRPLTYSWKKNGVTIPGANADTYSVQVFYASNGATFQCHIANSSGTVDSRLAVLTVNPVAPTITTQPVDRTVAENAIATFTVVATGAPLPTYQWKKNGVDIPGESSATLHYTAALADDGAAFQCEVTNVAGTVNTRVATLSVTAGPSAPVIVTQPLNRTVNDGATATFSVTVDGSAPFSYQWFRNGTAITGATSDTYSLTTAFTDDGALFSVTITNALGNVTSRQALLNVLPAAPSIASEPADFVASEGIAANLTVTAAGTPPFSYQWFRNGSPISGANAATYSFVPALTDNGTLFRCRVTNAYGNTLSRIITVGVGIRQVAPTITTEPVDANVAEGATAVFTVLAVGPPAPAYQWERNGVDLANETSPTLSVVAHMMDTEAAYRCRVSNALGIVFSRAAVLRVRGNPEAIQVQGGARGFVNLNSNEQASVFFTPMSAGGASMEIFSTDGIKVRTVSGDASAGGDVLRWDGRDDSGQKVKPGVYIFNLTAPGVNKTGKIVILD